MKTFSIILRAFLWMSLLTGLIYPLIVTGIADLFFRSTAEGSLLQDKGHIIGSRLIAQKFSSEKYFWPRPSAVDYNPLPSGGSNLGPTSIALKETIKTRHAAIAKSQGMTLSSSVPSELLYASGSGLDPHISLSTAYFQIERIAKARGLEKEAGAAKIKEMIDHLAEKRAFGFIGDPCICVLLLNKALDELNQK